MSMARPRLVMLSVFGLGRLRPAPGTWGSLPPVALAIGLIAGGLGPVDAPFIYAAIMVGVLVVFSGVCVIAGDAAEKRLGRRDPSEIVADETAGQCVPLLALPVGYDPGLGTVIGLPLLAFLSFRLMDIIKPPPARQLEGAPGGWGVLLDDLIAGLYALVLMWLVLMLLGAV